MSTKFESLVRTEVLADLKRYMEQQCGHNTAEEIYEGNEEICALLKSTGGDHATLAGMIGEALKAAEAAITNVLTEPTPATAATPAEIAPNPIVTQRHKDAEAAIKKVDPEAKLTNGRGWWGVVVGGHLAMTETKSFSVEKAVDLAKVARRKFRKAGARGTWDSYVA